MREEEIFLAALERPDPALRAAYLDAACADAPALRRRVEALLRSHQDPDSFLDGAAHLRQPTVTAAPSAGGDGPTEPEEDNPLAGLGPPGEPGSLGRLDHYEVLELVGRGGMGVVFRARDTKLQRVVALKVLAPRLAESGPARRRFIREAQAAAAVRDDHVVGIHAVGDIGPVPYLVMEFIGGTTLDARIRHGGPFEAREILRIGLQAARGLAAAHAQGLIHRDIKPANILLENGVQRVKITDFGLARAADDASLTQTGAVTGTPLYMSPEQARGEVVDQRSDLFSLGSVLYTLCTGRPAFRAGSSMAVLRRVCDDPPRPVREVNPDIPEWLAEIVRKLLVKDPAGRYGSAAELAGILGRHLAELQGPNSPRERRSAESREGDAPTARRRRRRAIALSALAACGVALGTAAILRSRPGPVTDGADSQSGTVAGSGQSPAAPADEAGVLTVSQNPAAGGRFRTIQAALDSARPGTTVRVLDNAVYDERLLVSDPDRHRGLVLEAANRATIRRVPGVRESVWIRGVPGVTLRGFRFAFGPDGWHCHVLVSGQSPGVTLDRLDLPAGHIGIMVRDLPLLADAAPVVVRDCTLAANQIGVYVLGIGRDPDRPLPCAQMIVRDNTFVECNGAVRLQGEVHRVEVVGNRVVNSAWHGVDLADLLPGTDRVVVANNTFLRNERTLVIWDEHAKGKAFLKCDGIRVENNLVLDPLKAVDLYVQDHPRGDFNGGRLADMAGLLRSPGWRFGHNWRELSPLRPDNPDFGFWVPACTGDYLQSPIKAGSRRAGDPDFVRPPPGSPLGSAGVGGSDPPLPAYVGAVPPVGISAWDWDQTWKALVR